MSTTGRALQYLSALDPTGIEPGLERIQAALVRLDHPEERFRIVRVGGTNGKGSVSALIAATLTGSGHRVGLYTSPHLVDVRERIRVDGSVIAPSALARAIERVRRAVERAPRIPLSYFELLTAVALVEFARRRVEVAVLEVGLGGRWDATNVGRAVVAVVTNVELDHMEYLGGTRRAIAREKVEIASPGGDLVSGVRAGAARAVIEEHARRNRIRIHVPDPPARAAKSEHRFSHRGTRFPIDPMSLGLGAGYQLGNAALAVQALEVLDERGVTVCHCAVRRTLASLRWPGRLQILERRPRWILDGAHNPHGARALAHALVPMLEPVRGRRVLVVGALRSKAPRAIVAALARAGFDRAVCTEVPERDATPPALLARLAREAGLSSVAVRGTREALACARRFAGRDGAVVVAGSLYLVGAALRVLKAPVI